MTTRTSRARRTCLAVPGSSPRFLAKAQTLDVDEVFLDLEDAVAPAQKADARATVAAALRAGDWGSKVRAVRINDATTGWAYRDVVDLVEQAGEFLDVIILPKVARPGHITWLDLLLGQVEQATGFPAGRIGIEAQIEDAAGLAAVDEIAAASPRLEALVFGPADFMASLGMRSLEIGAQPAGYQGGDAFHYPHLRILVAARARGLQAIDGPYAAIHDAEGLRRNAASVAALGYDGQTAVYDITEHAVYLPNGAILEAHSGMGDLKDDPEHISVRTQGATPPATYDLKPRETAFHGVQALRMTPVEGSEVYGRAGLLTHSYMLGPKGDSNGCVSIRDYDRFLKAYNDGAFTRLVVVPSLRPAMVASQS